MSIRKSNIFIFPFRENQTPGYPNWEVHLDITTGKGWAYDIGDQAVKGNGVSVPLLQQRKVALQVDTASVAGIRGRTYSPATSLGSVAIWNTGQTLAAILPNS